MNRNFLTIAFALVALVSVPRVLAQGTATPSRPPAPATANVPVSKMAVIYSAAFQDPKTGIVRFTITLNKLNSEFQKVQDDLTQTAQRLRVLQDEINKLQQTGAATPAQVQAKIDALDLQKKEYTRKGEDAKAQYQKRYQDVFVPLQDDVSRALNEYSKAHGITLIIDGSQTPILYAAESIDITRTFINEYNLKNPATAQVTSPK
ncbi:MAG: outer membrane protein [Blastocatellia bacterium]|jgi:Skp family chaperone for outer membrane proteins|nr:outer membrane protein [Blastocatellia bacterium]